MDGASKFVRGDAIAGLLIMVINIIGGLIVGVVQHDMDFAAAAKNYTLLTIGDGLVAQIPSLVISTAAGVIVSRVATNEDIGTQLTGQLFTNPRVLIITGCILVLMGLIPGMPHFAFLLLGGGLIQLGRTMKKRADRLKTACGARRCRAGRARADRKHRSKLGRRDDDRHARSRSRLPADSARRQELGRRTAQAHQEHPQEVRAGNRLPAAGDPYPRQPRIAAERLPDRAEGRRGGRRRGVSGPVARDQSGAGVSAALPGTPTQDPAFGLPAIWIDTNLREQAQVYGYTVVDSSTVVATHLNHLVVTHASELLGRREMQALIERMQKDTPSLVDDLVPKALSLTTLQKVLQNLLEEGVPIRDMRTILEALAEHTPKVSDAHELTAAVRLALGRAITQQWFPGTGDMQVMGLDSNLERVLSQALSTGANPGLEPGLAHTLMTETQKAMTRQQNLGLAPVLLVQHSLRPMLARFLRRSLPQLKVLSYAEVPDTRNVKVVNLIGGIRLSPLERVQTGASGAGFHVGADRMQRACRVSRGYPRRRFLRLDGFHHANCPPFPVFINRSSLDIFRNNRSQWEAVCCRSVNLIGGPA